MIRVLGILAFAASIVASIDPTEILKDSFSIKRPFTVRDFNSSQEFICKLHKGVEITNCLFEAPDKAIWEVKADGTVVLNNGNAVPDVEGVFNSTQCGIKLVKFNEANFGWWACWMNDKGHKGTFKVNKQGEWPNDIRLPEDIEVSRFLS